MSVLIINITGNQRKFENQFCNDLSSKINAETKIKDIRGEDLLAMQGIDGEGHEVIVVVGHAGRNGKSNTILDCGFGWKLLDNPTIFTQLLGNNNKRFILVYCACSALSPETLVSGIEDQNCIGVVASRNPVKYTHASIVAEVINLVHEFILENNQDIDSLQRNIRNLVKQYDDYPDFWIF
ncbi:hypothetical protein [Clostridium autoethanogenum]|uniref:CHAT domain containing protein n=1 Tax=Clostridium autoethanogenum DSM 10061 TaxID=1341692 RepID=A0ABN4BDX7_9CLOT|nr:hypothetical protein [Clostridium autoethanogenum]AGY75866.1 hypothetical protein CAETHG_1645 [Clostridium autoethanogenum DSM 10061]ALU36032.1 Hypothetical protein CLAU_1603 [Clostridium autoethanogenum DSM 10061]OVY51910.1 hypothetical protein WX72_00787 [Clostridium autoethanogenum]DAD54168.1 TPA_exp: protein of unknown function KV_049 [Clostridium autoethanogenum DSM 10061]